MKYWNRDLTLGVLLSVSIVVGVYFPAAWPFMLAGNAIIWFWGLFRARR